MLSELDLRYMKQAIVCAEKDPRLQDLSKPTRIGVGAVLVTNNRGKPKVYKASGSKYDSEHHAEATLLHAYESEDLTGATLYTTLEPCTTRNHSDFPCAELIIRRGISRVVIGMFDPNPDIAHRGYDKLDNEEGIDVELCPPELRKQIEGGPMKSFIEAYSPARALSAILTRDYWTWGKATSTGNIRMAQLSDYIHKGNNELILYPEAMPTVEQLEKVVPPFYRSALATGGAEIVGLDSLMIKTDIALRNSREFEQLFRLNGCTGELPGYTDDGTLRPSFLYATHLGNVDNVVKLEPGSIQAWPATITLARMSIPGVDNGLELARQLLMTTEALRRMLLYGIEGLSFEISLLDGNPPMAREFGVKVLDPEATVLSKMRNDIDIPEVISKVEALQKLERAYWSQYWKKKFDLN